jgi:replicative DNA helicase
LKDWKARTTRSLLKEFINRDLKEESINEIIFELNNVAQAGVKETFNKKEELLKQYEALDREPEKVGMKSGFTDLDLMTDGFQHGDSIIIGARPSMGKTALILNIALNVARNGVIPIIFSLEMGRESLIKRMLSALGRVDGSFAHNPYKYIKGEDRIRWTDAIGVLEKVDFHIFDKSEQTINEMRSKVRQIQRDYLNQRIVVMIDYLTLIKPINTFNGNAHQQVTEISKQLKVMAKDFGIPVLTLAQLSRSVEQRHNKRPMMSDLRESGSIEQDADLIMLLYRDHYYNEESPEKNLLEINITKQRNGAIGTILLQYEKEYNLVRNLSRR